MKSRFRLALAIAACALCTSTVSAQSWPTRPIHIYVGFPPGGGVDLMARAINVELGQRLGQSVVIDNRPGSGGNIAALQAAKADADGTTLLVSAISSLAIGASIYKNLQYDVLKDLTPVAVIGSVPNVLVINQNVKASNVKELIALAKAHPGTLHFGSAGNGTTVHMAGELFKLMAGIDMQHVPYKGAAPAMSDLLGGQVEMMFDFLSAAQPHIKSGKLRALGVTSAARSPAMPNVPTIAEAGLPGYAVLGSFGVMAPSATPAAVLDKLNAEIGTVVASPAVRARLLAQAATPEAMSRAQLQSVLKSETAKWADVVKKTGAVIE
ncbi:MAG TPA: tripartite tricarboxylate transporter substrate binding protein [Burkholderiales bacterium]|jgi:tripartite-type tricarboxylate transporter receptor subunit TctC